MPTQYEPDNNEFMPQSDTMHQTSMWDLLSAYADGETSAEDRARFEAMMLMNPSLTDDLAFLRRTSIVVRTLAEVDPPATLRSAIYARTTHRPSLAHRVGVVWKRMQTSFAPRPVRRLSLAGGACLAAGLMLALLIPRGHAPYQQTRRNHSTISALVAVARPAVATPISRPTFVFPPILELDRPITRLHEAAKSVPDHRHQLAVSNLAASSVASVTGASKIPMANQPTALVVHTVVHTPDLRVALPKSPKRLLTVNTPQSPHSSERLASDSAEGGYSHLPGMDLVNQRAQLITASARAANDTLGANIDTNRGQTTLSTEKKTDTQADDAPRKTIRIVQLSQLPPDARRYITASDIKRDMDARNLGFSRTTMEGIKREEATVALIGGKF